MTAWLAMTAATAASKTSGKRNQSGANSKNGFFKPFGMRQHHRALAEIIEHQARQHQSQPCKTDRAAAKMAHVGVKRFRARHRQEHRAHHHKTQAGMRGDELERIHRVHRTEDGGIIFEMDRAKHAHGDEPHRRDRAEDCADFAGAPALQHEHADHQAHGNRQNQRRRDAAFQ